MSSPQYLKDFTKHLFRQVVFLWQTHKQLLLHIWSLLGLIYVATLKIWKKHNHIRGCIKSHWNSGGNLNIMSPFHRHTQTHHWKSHSTTRNDSTGLFMYAWVREAQWLTRWTSPAHRTWTLPLWVCVAVVSEAPLRLLHHTDDAQLAQVHWSVQVAHAGPQVLTSFALSMFFFFFSNPLPLVFPLALYQGLRVSPGPQLISYI